MWRTQRAASWRKPLDISHRSSFTLPYVRPISRITSISTLSVVSCPIPLSPIRHQRMLSTKNGKEVRTTDEPLIDTQVSQLIKTINTHPKLWSVGITLVAKIIASIIATAIVSFVPLSLWYSWYVESQQKKRVTKAFEDGSFPQIPQEEAELIIPRPTVVSSLLPILLPKRSPKCYYLISGEHGTGKTTSVILACQQAKELCKKEKQPVGIIFVDAVKPQNFAQDLAKALGYRFEDEGITFWGTIKNKMGLSKPADGKSRPSREKYDWIEGILLKNAQEYTKKYKRPPVLLIDNVNRLAVQEPELLCNLQDFAKDRADYGDLIIIFISSEGSGPRFLQGRSVWSRAKKPPIEIDDLSDDKAIQYLVEYRKVPQSVAEQIVAQVTGGRISLLHTCADELVQGRTVEEIKNGVFNTVKDDYDNSGLLDETPQREYGMKVIAAILSHPQKEVSYDQFRELVPREMREVLLNSSSDGDSKAKRYQSVFSYHPGRYSVGFQSRVAQIYGEEAYKQYLEQKTTMDPDRGGNE